MAPTSLRLRTPKIIVGATASIGDGAARIDLIEQLAGLLAGISSAELVAPPVVSMAHMHRNSRANARGKIASGG